MEWEEDVPCSAPSMSKKVQSCGTTAVISLHGFCPLRHHLKIDTQLKNKLLFISPLGPGILDLIQVIFRKESEIFQY